MKRNVVSFGLQCLTSKAFKLENQEDKRNEVILTSFFVWANAQVVFVLPIAPGRRRMTISLHFEDDEAV
ncbi:hypothetical protein P8452_66387 [Trifolium repens]|nr:hypothetical protein P8452_66387 [Trifolium repens]